MTTSVPLEPHRVDLEEMIDLPRALFQPDEPVRLDVTLGTGNVLPLLVIARAGADQVLIMNNGAVDLERSQGLPVFQRSSWSSHILSHQIYVCDPGTVGDEGLSLNWMQAQMPAWMPTQVTRATRVVSAKLGVSAPERRTYFGSSAGGYAALVELAADRGARAIVNNAQFDWTRWYAPQVKSVLDARYSGRLAADVRKRWPHRTSALKQLARGNQPLRIEYWVNMASKYDREIPLKHFQDFFTKHPELCEDVITHRYHDPQMGHNPMPQGRTLEILNSRIRV
ncbi:hypothetical protein JRG18_07340 [Kocuria palustris]|jgi:hypothetical protein|uniref:hypothetical protein n=1 Tax=Kocuria palustris TaxID=71999 RepID=UPI0012DC480A|nr:hypothetical protein [Kocuria palustris]MBN6754223.1 hypothetical protein [Kocuria palustris]MBN6758290.1 hypothetical protein [Kocuria palustris]MBN6763318.1 hypothetical protein [Kocuria palustris]MBN6783284.1 hypothetical protein [Kocuria palustris]MBN6798837.1 hypothetical protein [Kocuria palustris]